MSDDDLRLGIIGLGNIGAKHAANVHDGEVTGCRVTAVCSRTARTTGAGATHYIDYRALIDSGDVDAVLVATPTYTHGEIGRYALERGLHVMMEKPIGLSVHDGGELVAAADAGQVLAVMLNQRTDPVYLEMKAHVDKGALGEIRRTNWTMTNWFRPEVYFRASDWRATWRGEGGGLLVNQCIHNLDVFQWICGMPSRVTARCAFGKYHDIEVEDEVTALIDYAGGATGVFTGSTGEAPGFNRFDVVGDRATLSYDGRRLCLLENRPAVSVYNRETREMFGSPGLAETDITPAAAVNQHAAVLEDFVAAIRDGTEPIASGADSLASLELANAMLLSGWRGEPVDLPLDGATYHEELARRIRGSSLRQTSGEDVVVDMDKSYR